MCPSSQTILQPGGIRELVDSLCRDGMDVQYFNMVHHHDHHLSRLWRVKTRLALQTTQLQIMRSQHLRTGSNVFHIMSFIITGSEPGPELKEKWLMYKDQLV